MIKVYLHDDVTIENKEIEYKNGNRAEHGEEFTVIKSAGGEYVASFPNPAIKMIEYLSG